MDGVTPRDYKDGYYEVIGYLIQVGAVRPESIPISALLEECVDREEPPWSELLEIMIRAEDAPIDTAPIGDPETPHIWLTDRETAIAYYDALFDAHYDEVADYRTERILPTEVWENNE